MNSNPTQELFTFTCSDLVVTITTTITKSNCSSFTQTVTITKSKSNIKTILKLNQNRNNDDRLTAFDPGQPG